MLIVEHSAEVAIFVWGGGPIEDSMPSSIMARLSGIYSYYPEKYTQPCEISLKIAEYYILQHLKKYTITFTNILYINISKNISTNMHQN
jgi:hypothetical protein